MRVRWTASLGVWLAGCGGAAPVPPQAASARPVVVATRAPVASATPVPVSHPAPVESLPDLDAEAGPSGVTLDPQTRFQVRMLKTARAQLRTFIDKAGDRPEFAEAVQRSRERIDDITQTIRFLEGGSASEER